MANKTVLTGEWKDGKLQGFGTRTTIFEAEQNHHWSVLPCSERVWVDESESERECVCMCVCVTERERREGAGVRDQDHHLRG